MSTAVSSLRRERAKTVLRGKILDAARELFADQGYEAVTMRSIAERIEYTPTTIYAHFQDKEALLRELCTQDYQAFGQQLAQCVDADATPIDTLRRIAGAYIQFALQHPHHYRYMFMTPLPPCHIDDSAVERGNPNQDAYAFLKAWVNKAIACGALQPAFAADTELTAQTLWAGVHGFVALRLTMRQDDWIDWVDIERAGAALLDALLHGISRIGEA